MIARLAMALQALGLPFTGSWWPTAGGAMLDFWRPDGRVRWLLVTTPQIPAWAWWAERLAPPPRRLLTFRGQRWMT